MVSDEVGQVRTYVILFRSGESEKFEYRLLLQVSLDLGCALLPHVYVQHQSEAGQFSMTKIIAPHQYGVYIILWCSQPFRHVLTYIHDDILSLSAASRAGASRAVWHPSSSGSRNSRAVVALALPQGCYNPQFCTMGPLRVAPTCLLGVYARRTFGIFPYEASRMKVTTTVVLLLWSI